ncbi:MAG TPA: linear amide C-N hydrolase [Gammaproteobacteria bacterium]
MERANACTRVVYLGPEGRILTARSMDWARDIGTNLWIFPRGMQRNSAAGESSLTWTSRYGSVVASAYDLATSDGMNEAGLAANLLWLAESEYPEWNGEKPGMSVSVWTQYVLDNFATVAEAVEQLSREPFTVVTDKLPDEDLEAALHLSISDATGDSAIFEYVGGRLVIHHDRAFQVMTNSPTFDQQLAITGYWNDIGGTVMLPGTNRAADRFVRAKFYINAVPHVEDRRTATAAIFSVIRNVSVPIGITTPDQPNISSTRWRTVADHKSRVYYFESALTPNVFWVEFANVDFTPGAGVRVLELGENQSRVFSGDVSSQFVAREPFVFMEVRPPERDRAQARR